MILWLNTGQNSRISTSMNENKEIFSNTIEDWSDEPELSMEEVGFFASYTEAEMNRAFEIFEENEPQWRGVENISFVEAMRRTRPEIESARNLPEIPIAWGRVRTKMTIELASLNIFIGEKFNEPVEFPGFEVLVHPHSASHPVVQVKWLESTAIRITSEDVKFVILTHSPYLMAHLN